MLGNIAQSLDIGDLPIVPGNMRATMNFAKMRHAMREIKFKLPVGRERWSPKTGTGWNLAYRLLVVNILPFTALFVLAAISALLFYTPAVFLQRLVKYLEEDGKREDMSWGWVWVVGLFVSNAITFLSEFSLSLPVLGLLLLEKLVDLDRYSYWPTMVLIHDHDPSPSSYTVELDPVRENSCSERRCFISTITTTTATTTTTTRWSEVEDGGRREER